MNAERLLALFDRVSEAPDAVAKLRRFVLDLAVRGKLVEQDPADEPADALASRMREQKARVLGLGRKAATVALKDDLIPHDLPKSWAWVALGDVFIYDAGNKHEPSQLDPEKWLLELEDIEKDTSRVAQRLKVRDRESLSTKSEFRVGDVLYGKLRPYLNKVVAADEPGYCTTEIVAIRSAAPISSEYCCLALKRTDFVEYVERLGRGTKMPRLRTPDAVAAPFPLPPLAEQRRIVARVDELMALCDQLEADRIDREHRRDRLSNSTLARLDLSRAGAHPDKADVQFALMNLPKITSRSEQVSEMRRAIRRLAVRGALCPQNGTDEPAERLLERISASRTKSLAGGYPNEEEARAQGRKQAAQVLPANLSALPPGWSWATLMQCSHIVIDCRNKTAPYVSAGIPLIRTTNVRDGKINAIDLRFVDQPTYERWSSRSYPEPGDILITREAPMGEVCVIPEGMTICLGQRMMLARLVPDTIDPAFLLCSLQDPDLMERVQDKPIGATVQHLRVGGVETLLVPLPPLAEQHRIVARVDELMALCDQLEASLAAADTASARLLDAILHEALNGSPQAEAA